MATRLFVGKLSFDTTDESLRTLFSQFGTVVSSQTVIDRGSGMSKGFGFVDMETPESAQAAINALDGKEFEGRVIVVNVARAREQQGGNNFRGGFQRR